MIESGSYNLAFILAEMKNLEFTNKCMIAIKKATQSRAIVLLDAFVKNKIIEIIYNVLQNDYGDELLLKI